MNVFFQYQQIKSIENWKLKGQNFGIKIKVKVNVMCKMKLIGWSMPFLISQELTTCCQYSQGSPFRRLASLLALKCQD